MKSKNRERIGRLLASLQEGIYEKETEIRLSLLAALSGECILLLGPPGVAKSMVARRMKNAFRGARSFEYLMSRFSTPDELFGPVSISRLKESDSYERAIDGFLPTADVVFLDEIWKAGPAIQNTLLTVMNEKLFRNGSKELHLPLKLLVAASNELPAKDEGLEALWDRFLIRLVSSNIRNESTFRTMLLAPDPSTSSANEPITEALSEEELSDLRRLAADLPIPEIVLEAVTLIREGLCRIEPENSDLARKVYISDRRWRHIISLMRTEAAALGRERASLDLLLPMYHCLWNEPDEIALVRCLVSTAVFAQISNNIERTARRVKSDLRASKAREALERAVRENDHRDDSLLLVDRFYYQIENHGTGHSYIFVTDYKRMGAYDPKGQPIRGLIYTDPVRPERHIVRLYDLDISSDLLKRSGTEQVTLGRDDIHLYINGVAYRMRTQDRAQFNPAVGKVEQGVKKSALSVSIPPSEASYETEIDQACDQLEALMTLIEDNLFISPDEYKEAEAEAKRIKKAIALTRVDIRRLLYNEE